MSKCETVAPYQCDQVHVAWRTIDERDSRWKQVGEWAAAGNWPSPRPAWLLFIKFNHGGSGGP